MGIRVWTEGSRIEVMSSVAGAAAGRPHGPKPEPFSHCHQSATGFDTAIASEGSQLEASYKKMVKVLLACARKRL